MSFNLLDAVKGYLTPDLISKASSFLGENEGGVSKALNGILPTVLSGFASKAANSDGANQIATMAAETHNSGLLGNLGSFFGEGSLLDKGADIVKGLFGGKLGGIVEGIASFAGIGGGSVGKLLGFAAPLALGALGKHAASTGLGASGIASLLSGGKSSWASMLPAGLGSLLGGVSSFASGAAEKVTGTAASIGGHAEDAYETAKGGGMKWLLPLLLLVGLGALAYFLLKDGGCSPKKAATEANKDGKAEDTTKTSNVTAALPKITVDTTTGVVSYDLGASMDIELPNGTKLTGVATNGFENTLFGFIKNGTIDTMNKKANWFNLHDVQFISGKTQYATPKAMAQIKNVAEILKAYPNVKIKLGGYTDASGNAAANKTLSQNRANQVKKDLIASGAKAEQIVEAVGYGSEFAEAKVGDKEGMARDRKTAAKVASK
jgi:outer membrane protein OmpA-like peptidoglycan-associated protein